MDLTSEAFALAKWKFNLQLLEVVISTFGPSAVEIISKASEALAILGTGLKRLIIKQVYKTDSLVDGYTGCLNLCRNSTVSDCFGQCTTGILAGCDSNEDCERIVVSTSYLSLVHEASGRG